MLPLVEDFHTLQGEGAWTGTAAWFIRLGGCDVGCGWCDAKETWNPRVHPLRPVEEVVARVPEGVSTVVVTGGEPLMWNLDELTERLRARGMKTHLETSGSHPFSGEWDWVCLSPKRKQPPLDEAWGRADELKAIIETPEDLKWAEEAKTAANRRRPEVQGAFAGGSKGEPGAAVELFLQPEWSRREEIMPVIVEYIKKNPRWRMSLQAHKYMRIP